MYCQYCGKHSPDHARHCVHCGVAMDAPVTVQKVPNYLVPAILSTIFCCLPAGIVAIVHAARVDAQARMGDFAGAQQSSALAKKWAWRSFLLALLVGVAVGILYAVVFWVALASTANNMSTRL